MWIGPYNEPVEFKDPATGMTANRVGWGASGTYVTGGGWAVGGRETHLQYNLNWPFLRAWQVSLLEDAVDPSELLTVLVATAYEINAIPPSKTSLSALGAGTHALSIVPAGERWQFSWEGQGAIEIPGHGLVGPGLYDGVGTGEWFSIFRPEPPEDMDPSDADEYGGDMVLTFGDIVRYKHVKTRGRGNTGMRLKMPEGVQVTEYSSPSANDYSSVTLTLVETGAWE